ncbi:MAG: hypothetical protein IJQ02_00515 [Oscillospiraceae bacterium]|nr:hypothetical protein [Oscillospiraceae bacterium]
METGKSNNELTRKLDGAVERARKVEEWRSAYMIESIRLMDARDEGREEGREEERKNTEEAIKRAEEAEQRAKDESKRADDAEQRADTAEVIIAKYKEKYGELA